ncbi:MAG: hypothetical protein CM15mP9_5000 [Methanobacteriota archaeon]|nr:MAG: hypothetical protein CM15mP9_5000 [Euryarchaeota archaeon]
MPGPFPLLPSDRRGESESLRIKLSILPLNLVDVSSRFSSCEAKRVKQGLAEKSVMLALPLPGFSGLIGTKEFDADGAQMPRLGRELAGAS